MENWKTAESFYREAVREVSKNLLEESGLTMKDIDLVLVTENNIKIWELTLETLGVNADKSISLIRNMAIHVSYAPASYRSWISYGENRKRDEYYDDIPRRRIQRRRTCIQSLILNMLSDYTKN